jgi:hypothetical protein
MHDNLSRHRSRHGCDRRDAVAWPLLRTRAAAGSQASRPASLVIGAAAGLYPLWSNWNWHAAPAGFARAVSPDVAAMVAKLEKHAARAAE